jgi:glycosyltransferase involved in cell wall biosynthesis
MTSSSPGFSVNASAATEQHKQPAPRPRIGILVVSYNAESTLRSVLQRIPAPIMEKVDEIFVFDDASQDRTVEVGEDYKSDTANDKISIFRNPVNLMYGGNQRRGYQYAIERGLDIVVLLHGDGQYAPEVMQDLIASLEQGKAEMVMGSRMLVPGAALRGNMPMYKFVGNRILTTLQNWFAGTSFSEFHSGYRAYSVGALRTLDLQNLTTNWHFDTQIILQFLKRGYRVVEVPIPTYYGDEICHVNGIPYAMNCIREVVLYALRDRWRPRRAVPTTPETQK